VTDRVLAATHSDIAGTPARVAETPRVIIPAARERRNMANPDDCITTANSDASVTELLCACDTFSQCLLAHGSKNHTRALRFECTGQRRNQRMRTVQSDLLSARGQPDTVTTASDVCGFGCASCKQPHERNAGRSPRGFPWHFQTLQERVSTFCWTTLCSLFLCGCWFVFEGGWQHVVVLGPALGGRERRRFRGRAIVSRRRRRQR
jgi:hypothetical protein